MSKRNAPDFAPLEVPSAAKFDELPKGIIGSVERSADATGIVGSDVTLVEEDVPVLMNRFIELIGKCEVVGPTAGDTAEVDVRIFRDSILLDRCIHNVLQQSQPGDTKTFIVFAADKIVSANTYTYKMTARRADGGTDAVSVNVQTGVECRLIVKDVGPFPLE